MRTRKAAVMAAVESLKPTLAAMLAGTGVPGCAASVVFEDGDTAGLTLGTKQPGTELAPDGQTVFMIGSCSKAFTALTASVLAADGRIDLDAAVSDHLPIQLRYKGQPITLRHLLTNSSGLPNLGMSEIVTGRHLYGKIPGAYADSYPFGGADSVIEFLRDAEDELAGPPGAQYIYSNEGFSLAGEVLAAATGKPFIDLVRETVFGPLGMASSGYGMAELPPAQDLAMGSLSDGRTAPAYFEPAIAGAGGILSTADDMGRFVAALLGDGLVDGARVLPSGGVRGMEIGRSSHRTAESLVGPGFGPELYGMGLMVYPDYLGTRVLTHGGSTGNFSSSIFYTRELGFGIASLCNTGNGEGVLALFAFMVAAAVLGKDPSAIFPAFALERRLRGLEGEYRCRGRAVSARIQYRQGRLWWESTDGNGNSPGGAHPLETVDSPDGLSFRFVNGPGASSEVTFSTGPDGLMRVWRDRNILTRREAAG